MLTYIFSKLIESSKLQTIVSCKISIHLAQNIKVYFPWFFQLNETEISSKLKGI